MGRRAELGDDVELFAPDGVVRDLEGAPGRAMCVHVFAPQFHSAARDAGEVEKVINQARLELDVPADSAEVIPQIIR